MLLGLFQDILLLQISERSAKNITLSMTRNGLFPRKGEEAMAAWCLATKNGPSFLIFLLLLLLIFFLLLLRRLILIIFIPGLDPGGEISQDGKRTKWA